MYSWSLLRRLPPLTTTCHESLLPQETPLLWSRSITLFTATPHSPSYYPHLPDVSMEGDTWPKVFQVGTWAQDQETPESTLSPSGAVQSHDPNPLQLSRITTFIDEQAATGKARR